MTRTQRYRLQYVATLLVLLVPVGLAGWHLRDDPIWLIGFGLLLFVPGRLSGLLWRDLYRGRRLLEAGEAQAGLDASQRFVDLLSERPALRGLWWLAWGFYTRDPEAMARNNIGAARLELGNLDEAEAAFRGAIAIDPEYAIPYSNLAAISTLRGDEVEAASYAERAARLGYSRDAIDRMIQAASSALARLEGRGPGIGPSHTDA